MNNSSIMKIILYVILIVILLGFMIFVLLGKGISFKFGSSKSKELYNEIYKVDEVEKLDVNLVSANVLVKESEDNDIHVIINGTEDDNDRFKVSINDSVLKITEDKMSTIWIGIHWFNEEAIIYLPSSYDKDIKIHTVSGEILFMNSYDSDMNIEAVSGSVKLLNAKNINVKTTSGDIDIKSAMDIEAKSTSGEITVESGKYVKATTTSGDIEIGNVEEGDISSTSGEVEIGKSGNINISTMSGDIEIDNLMVIDKSYIKSTSGEVKVHKVNDVYVDTNTVSGDVKVKNNNRKSDNVLTIKTTSGDIEVG